MFDDKMLRRRGRVLGRGGVVLEQVLEIIPFNSQTPCTF
jgi:hypothetical protein